MTRTAAETTAETAADEIAEDRREFPFRPWVGSSCRRAMVWGVGVVVALGIVAWLFRQPGSAPLSRAFGVLVFYGSLFWLTLVKIWWTATRTPAVELDNEALAYQPLHTFRPRRLAWSDVLALEPRKGTSSLRFVFQKSSGRAREFFLNLAVVDRGGEFFQSLERRLEGAGLVPDPEVKRGWKRPGWEDSVV